MLPPLSQTEPLNPGEALAAARRPSVRSLLPPARCCSLLATQSDTVRNCSFPNWLRHAFDGFTKKKKKNSGNLQRAEYTTSVSHLSDATLVKLVTPLDKKPDLSIVVV